MVRSEVHKEHCRTLNDECLGLMILQRCISSAWMLAETPGDPGTKEELVETEYGGGQDTEPLRPSSAGTPSLPPCRPS